MRVAALDLGTNTTRLLVADVVDGRIEEVGTHEQLLEKSKWYAEAYAQQSGFQPEAVAK